MLYVLLAIAGFLIFETFFINTHNFLSTLVFKVIPVASGLFIAFYVMTQLGWLIQVT